MAKNPFAYRDNRSLPFEHRAKVIRQAAFGQASRAVTQQLILALIEEPDPAMRKLLALAALQLEGVTRPDQIPSSEQLRPHEAALREATSWSLADR